LPALKIARILDSLPPKEPLRLFDYGCGEGKLLRSIGAVRKIEPFGADIKTPLRSDDFAFFLLPDSEETLPKQSMDAVTSVDVLEHVKDIETTLELIASLLRPSGLFCGFVPTEGESLSLYQFYRALLGKDLYERTKDHIVAYRRQQLENYLRKRFDIVSLSYSYHIVGSTLDATFFALCRIPTVERWWWSSNAYYRPQAQPSFANRAMEAANLIAYWESRFLSANPHFSVGLHFAATPRVSASGGSR
jgi:SAM-dependent methyltransferase